MDLLLTDPMTGKRTGLAGTIRRTLRALAAADLPYCVIGATALAVRGLPRMTRDLHITVLVDDASRTWQALRAAGLRPETPLGTEEDPEPMVVFVDPRSNVDVDLLVAAGDPEASAIDRASSTAVFGVQAKVATLEDLLLLYLYSNQPKHVGDFAAIVQSGLADLARAEKALAEMHAEVLPEWQRRVREAKQPPPPPPKPPRRPRRG